MTHDAAWHAAWHAERRKGIGGSDANIIMSGDPERLIALWREKRGEAEPEDLSGNLAVQIGVATEELNRQWFARITGTAVVRAPDALVHRIHPFMRCNLDGVADGGHVFEAKHTHQMATLAECAERYAAQLHHNMAVVGCAKAYLSVFFGNARHEWCEVEADPFYTALLIEREAAFWTCVQSGEPPVPLPVIAPPVPPEKWRKVSFEGNNAWASLAASWIEHKDAAETFGVCAKEIKALVGPDVGTASGHGITAKRAKNGAITIRSET